MYVHVGHRFYCPTTVHCTTKRLCPVCAALADLGLGPTVVLLSRSQDTILVPIALFSSLSRQGLGTRIEGLFDSRAEALPAKR